MTIQFPWVFWPLIISGLSRFLILPVTDELLLSTFTIFKNRSAISHSFLHHEKTHWAVGGAIAAVLCLPIKKHLLSLFRPTPLTVSNKELGDIQPLFFPCKTTHTRVFPKKHSFQYSYLLTGFQVGWKGSVGGLLSVEVENNPEKAKDWFVVDASDYLDRGYGNLGLGGKLQRYLRSQDVDPADYPYAYLVTVPKLLGYAFNPVSFWYLYSAEKELTAMILEVNNTFDERRPYFLKIDENDENEEWEQVGTTSESPKKPKRFTNTWPKDFHVSPFNSRKGFYSLTAHDPLYPKMTGTGPIDNTITLLSSKSHPKLIARVFSDGDPINPSIVGPGFISRMRFLSDWWWIVYATAIRTIKEAASLYFKHGLHVWFRPEPLTTNMGRNADATERSLEVFFRKYLSHLVEKCDIPLQVKYTAAGFSDITPEIFTSPSAQEKSGTVQELEFKVLTPVFYTRFVHYAHDSEAFYSEFMESGTIHLSNPTILKSLIPASSAAILDPRALSGRFANFKYKLIHLLNLRRRPEILTVAQPGKKSLSPPPTQTQTTKTDIRTFPPSGLDIFVIDLPPRQQSEYIDLTFQLFLADRIAFGSISILWIMSLFVRVPCAWLIAGFFLSNEKMGVAMMGLACLLWSGKGVFG